MRKWCLISFATGWESVGDSTVCFTSSMFGRIIPLIARIYIYIFVNAISLEFHLHGFISVPWIVPATLYCSPASTTRCCSLYRSEVLMIQLFWLERHWLSLTGENSTIGVHKQTSVVPKLEQN